jgi:hypothetical protein
MTLTITPDPTTVSTTSAKNLYEKTIFRRSDGQEEDLDRQMYLDASPSQVFYSQRREAGQQTAPR